MVHSLWKKLGSSHLIQGVVRWKLRWCWRRWGVGENGAKTRVARKYSLAQLRAKLRNKCLWIGRSCWRKRIEFELTDKVWACKKTLLASFLSRLLENIWVKLTFPYALSVATLLWPSVGVKPNTWKKWGFGVLRDSRMFRARQQGPKHLALRCSWCHWKGIEA
jgi:hypothetical protein